MLKDPDVELDMTSFRGLISDIIDSWLGVPMTYSLEVPY